LSVAVNAVQRTGFLVTAYLAMLYVVSARQGSTSAFVIRIEQSMYLTAPFLTKWLDSMAPSSLSFLHPGEDTAELLNQFWMSWPNNTKEE
jgi:hypothetical protein